jgi:hypothetical protein
MQGREVLNTMEIDISPEVAALADTDVAAEVRHLAADDGAFVCPACERPGDTAADPVSAILVRAPQLPGPILSLAHRACMPSQVVDVPEVTVLPPEEPTAYFWVSHQAGDPAAWVILDYPAGAVAGTSAGEEVDLHISTMLKAGMELVTSTDRAPQPAGMVTIRIRDAAISIHHARLTLITVPLAWLEDWRDQATRSGEAVLLTGAGVFTGATPSYPPETADGASYNGGELQPLLEKAIAAGVIAGARVPVTADQQHSATPGGRAARRPALPRLTSWLRRSPPPAARQETLSWAQ